MKFQLKRTFNLTPPFMTAAPLLPPLFFQAPRQATTGLDLNSIVGQPARMACRS